MSVQSFDPNATEASGDIRVTAGAKQHIREQIQRSGHQHIRLGVKESGCNGYMYTLDFIDEPAANDLQVPVEADLVLIVAQPDLRFVGGTEIDLVEEGLNKSLRFLNPNAESHCGCGESFSVPASVDTQPSEDAPTPTAP